MPLSVTAEDDRAREDYLCAYVTTYHPISREKSADIRYTSGPFV